MVAEAEITEYNGAKVRELRNGALMDVETKRIVGNSPHNAASTVISTSERARELAHQRWHGEAQEGYKRAIQKALEERNETAIIETIEQARGKGIELMTSEIALNAGVREDWRIKAHEHALLQSGMDAREPKQAAGISSPPAGEVLDVSALERVVAALERAKDTIR